MESFKRAIEEETKSKENILAILKATALSAREKMPLIFPCILIHGLQMFSASWCWKICATLSDACVLILQCFS